MKKHIVGAAWQDDLGGHIVIGQVKEVGYARLVSVSDITGTREYPDIKATKEGFNLDYGTHGHKKLRLRFSDGYSTKLAVYLPSPNRKYIGGDLTLSANGKGLRYDSELSWIGNDISCTYATVPALDPYNVFGEYLGESAGDSWKMQSQEPFDGPQEQHLMCVSSPGSMTIDELLDNAYDSSGPPIAHGFSWSQGLEPLPSGELKEFQVCMEEGSNDWYGSTSVDVYGEWIPEEYVNGEQPALFISSGCQTHDAEALKFTAEAALTDTGDEEYSITVIVTQIASSLEIPYKVRRDPYLASRWPNKAPIEDSTFTFAIENGSGIIDVQTVTSDRYVFTGLEKGTYKAVVIEASTGAVAYAFLTAERQPDPTKLSATTPVPTGNTINSSGRVTNTTIVSIPATSPTQKECFCGILDAINYNAGDYPELTDTDPCNICWTCGKTDNLLYGGGVLVGQMVRDSGSPVTYASEGGSDGSIQFNGNLAPVPTGVQPYMPVTFTIDLYNVSAQGEVPTGTASQTSTSATQINAVFSSLAQGWYCVEVTAVHSTCVSRFWYYVGENAVRQICPFDVDVHIEPCYNMLTAQVTVPTPSDVAAIMFSLNGVNTAFLPVMVQPGDIFGVTASFLDGCKSTWTYTVTAADLNCSQLPEGPSGCMDPQALNFDPTAVVDSGRCIYGILGCMDPSATNYDPNATVGGECIYLCDGPIIASSTISSGTATLTLVDDQTNVDIVWTNLLTGETATYHDDLSHQVDDEVWLVTVTNSLGCTESTVISSSELYSGCMDTMAENYSPAANIPYEWQFLGIGTALTGPCEYRLEDSPCVPKTLTATLQSLDACIASKSTIWYDRMRAGLNSTCFTKHFQTLVLIRYLLNQHGLRCLFNCADPTTPSPYSTSCQDKWTAGGPSGSELVYENTRQGEPSFEYGDIVLYDGQYWTWTSLTPSSGSPIDPTQTGWKLCKDEELFTFTEDRLSQYMAFITDECRDCMNLNAKELPVSVPSDTDTDGGDPITDGGDPIILT